jgi:tRNA modification GTPase
MVSAEMVKKVQNSERTVAGRAGGTGLSGMEGAYPQGSRQAIACAPAPAFAILTVVQPGLDDPMFALATPFAPSALAVIRVSGRGSLGLLAAVLRGRPDLEQARGHTLRRAVIVDGAEPVDEVVVAVYRAPRSYTGEDGAEITCHGSLPVIRRILSLLARSGFREAGPGEFTQRAFLNGRMDLTRAEAVNEIVRARTDRARSLAFQRLSGLLQSKIEAVRDDLLGVQAALEACLDYPEEDHGASVDTDVLDRSAASLEALAQTCARGRLYQEGVSAALAGATNSGKSSLFNQLLRQDRAIVSEVHGTTRDWLEAAIDVEGIPVRLFDTAGTRDTRDPLEREGMRRTAEVLRSADLVMWLVDARQGVGPADLSSMDTVKETGARLLGVWNKIDLGGTLPCPDGFIPVSALTGEGLEGLEAAMAAALLDGTSDAGGGPLLDSERQRDLLGKALAALARFREDLDRGLPLDILAVGLREALDSLGGITGGVTSADVLERLFSRFCVGK